MSRIAVVIANSITAQPTQRGLGVSKVKRAADQLCELLAGLPSQFKFETRQLLDETRSRVLRELDRAASECRSADSLLLVYYFGHGKREPDGLAFVHRGSGKHDRESLTFQSMFYRVRAIDPSSVLFLLDCCYAGAAGRQVAELPHNRYCLIACTTASTRALWEKRGDTPIGVFTSALMDGFFNPAAAVSNVDDRITADSLFAFVKSETKDLTDGTQEPYMAGTLSRPISVYNEAPVIIPGITEGISLKSAYSKLRLIVAVLRRKTFPDLHTLYLAALSRDRRVFLTNYVDSDGRISQRPAHWTVLRKYISFLKAIGVVDSDDLRLTPRGEELNESPNDNYNVRLLTLIDAYLGRYSLSRDELKFVMQRVLQRRWLPTRANVLSSLIRRPVNESHIALVLDLLGHIGVIGTLKRKEQVYFPWGGVN